MSAVQQVAKPPTSTAAAPPSLGTRGVAVALLCVLGLALLTPYVEIVLGATQIGAFAPPAGAFLILVALVLLINPALRLLRRRPLSRTELAAAYAAMLAAAAVCSCQFAGWIVPVITGPFYYATDANKFNEYNIYMPELWRVENELAVRYFYEGLPYGARVPLLPWIKPIVVWLPFILAFYGGFLALSVLLGKQWIEREKLAFPLVQLPLEMTEPPPRLLPEIFLSKLMWLGAAIPAFVHTLNGLHRFYPAIPELRLHHVDLLPPGLGRPWSAAYPVWFHVYFWLIAMAYLASRDVPMSIVFFYLLFKAECVVGVALGISSNPQTRALTANEFPYLVAQKSGGALALLAMSLYAARRYLADTFSGRAAAEGEESALFRTALSALALCVAAMIGWLSLMGMSFWLALVLVALTFAFNVIYHRFMAEGGVNLLWAAQSGPNYVIYALFGNRPVGVRNWLILFSLPYFLWPFKGPVGPQSFEALKIAHEVRLPWRRVVPLMAAAVALAAVVAYWATIIMVYTHGGGIALDRYRFEHVGIRPFSELRAMFAARPTSGDPIKILAMLTSAGVVIGLSTLRWRFVWWRLHPIGFVMATVFACRYMWFSLFVGSVLGWLITRYGGVKAYRNARPFFLGLIFGDFIMLGIWFAVCAAAGVRGFRLFWD